MNSHKGFSRNLPESQKDKKDLPSLVNAGALEIIKDNLLRELLIRSERISSALYLVSASMPESEPLREAVRENAIDLVTFFEPLLSEGQDKKNRDFLKRSISAHLIETHSLLTVALVSGILPENTSFLIQEEIERLLALVHKEDEGVHEALMLPESFFDDYNFEAGLTEGRKESHDPKSAQSGPSQTTSKNVDRQKSASQEISKRTRGTKKAEERQEKILEVLRKRGESSLKDISSEIKNCSKKTLQRDLGTLNDKGIVHKRGSKRWSTYVLKK